ncbi:MAG: hypothetical protein PF503_20275, partial [Desulfobacula sp.]|nr:hypothetical protein [Desulfobacula sp.]
LEQIIDSNLVAFATDVDTLDPGEYKNLCGKNEIGNVLANLERLIQLREQRGGDVKFTVNTIITRHSLASLEEIYRRLDSIGVDHWTLTSLGLGAHPPEKGFLTRHNGFYGIPQEVYPMIKKLRKIVRKDGMTMRVESYFDPDIDNSSY